MNSISFKDNVARWEKLESKQINYAIKLIKKFKSKKHENITNTDWNVDSNVPREYFEYLWNECLNPFKQAFLEISKGKELILQNYWFQMYSKGDFHDWHTHPKAHFTNILYLQNTDDNPTEILGIDTSNNIPPVGSILTIPAFIFHRSNPIKTKNKKIIVSFNTSIR